MRRAAKVAALAVASAIMPQILYAQVSSVELWITSSDEAGEVAGLEAQPSLFFCPDAGDATVAIKVDDGQVYQRMEGGGAAFTDGAAWLINQKVSAAQRDQVMQRLFDPGLGIGLSFVRNPIGSSDLTREWYTHDDDASSYKAAPKGLPSSFVQHDDFSSS
jgi:glucosylceramidase